MKKKTFSGTESYNKDTTLTDVLRGVQNDYEATESLPRRRSYDGFLSYLEKAKIPLFEKVKLYDFLSRSPKGVLKRYDPYASTLATAQFVRVVSESYHSSFEKWWRSQARYLKYEYPGLDLRLKGIRNYKKIHLKDARLKGQFVKDFTTAIDALIHRTVFEIAKEKARLDAEASMEREFKEEDAHEPVVIYPQGERIEWVGQTTQLVYLINQLVSNKLISHLSHDNRFTLICDHFVRSDGKPFDKETLRETERKYLNNVNDRSFKTNDQSGKPQRAKPIDRMITSVRESVEGRSSE